MPEPIITAEMLVFTGMDSMPVTYDVEKGAVAKFARAIGDLNPLYIDDLVARNSSYGGLIAPPTFLRSLIPGRYAKPFPEPFSYVLDGGSSYTFFAPVRVGDRITVTRRFVELFEKQGKLGTMLFRVQEIKYVNQHGEVAATQRTTTISYGTGQRDPAIDDL
ncbi:MAG: MaoC family dehydratase [Dehalococcoidia bacterium]|nr:MaoC family dehydratase [Dehalococcoidia bacterium]MSQ35409.1 MaoC family dehydratase [Dehalococcoidia bacterium]